MADQHGKNNSELRTSDVKGLLDSLTNLEDKAQKAHPPGSQIGKYLVQRILGCQGQATLLLAIDSDLRRQVVLKLYHPGVSGQHRTRLVNEGRALARLSHENVATCHGIEEFNDHLYLVLEFVEGKSLREILNESSLEYDEMAAIFRQIAAGLHQVHQADLLHGDLKPANVMVKEDGTVKLIDFGLVQTTLSDATDGSGTPAYMAPERLNDPPVIDERSDIFSAGAILYEMLTGEPPFAAGTNQECRELARLGEIEPVKKRNPAASDELAGICSTCVAKHPAARYESAQALIEAMDAHGLEIAPITSTGVQSSTAGKLAICAMILGVLGGGFFAWQGTQKSGAQTVQAPGMQLNVTNEMYLGMDRLKRLPESVMKALSEDDKEAALAVTTEAIELASHPELAEGYLEQYEQLHEEVQRWAETSPENRAAISISFGELYDALAQRGALTEKESSKLNERCRTAVREISRVIGSEDSLILNNAKKMLAAIERNDPCVIELWREIADSGSVMFGVDSPYCLAAKYRLAYAASGHGQHDIANETFDEIAAAAAGASAPSRRIAHTALVAQSGNLERIDRSREAMEAARMLLDSIHPGEACRSYSIDKLYLLNSRIRVERKSNDDRKAIELGKQAMEQMDEDDPEVRLVKAMICCQLGFCYARTNQPKLAKDVISTGLDIERIDSGELSSRYANQLTMAALALKTLDEERAYEYGLLSYEINEETSEMNAKSAAGLINLASLSTADASRMGKHASEAFHVLQELRQTGGIGDRLYVDYTIQNAKLLNEVGESDLFDQSIQLASDVIEANLAKALDKDDVDDWEWLSQQLDAAKALNSSTTD